MPTQGGRGGSGRGSQRGRGNGGGRGRGRGDGRGRQGGGSGGRGRGGRNRGGHLNWNHHGQHGSVGDRGGQPILKFDGGGGGGSGRRPSWLNRLKSKEDVAELENAADADRFFRELFKRESSKELAMELDTALNVVLQDAMRIMHPNYAHIITLFTKLGDEALTCGVYDSHVKACYATIFGVDEYVRGGLLLRQLKIDPTADAAAAWFLIRLGLSDIADTVRTEPAVFQLLEHLKSSTQPGAAKLAKRLNVVFASNNDSGTVGAAAAVAAAGDHAASLAAATAMLPPGQRDHDNDKANFRDVGIFPTSRELQCTQPAYLPYPLGQEGGSEFLDCPEAATLDRQFRLLREDLTGAVKAELIDEFRRPMEGRRRSYDQVRVVGLGDKPEPHIIIQVAMPARLRGRVAKLKGQDDRVAFFDKGHGRRVLSQGSLVVLAKSTPKGGRKEQTNTRRGYTQKIPPITAVGTVVARRGIGRQPGVLEVGVSFTPESMSAVSTYLEGLEHRKGAASMGCILFNSSTGLFDYEPVLKVLQRMDAVALSDTVVNMQATAPPALAHGGKAYAELSAPLRAAVDNDPSQVEALTLVLEQNVVIVQGPPGTGKTYVGVKMVRAMLEMERSRSVYGRSTTPLQIMCLCYTNHALDAFLLDLVEDGVPLTDIVRVGGSSKVHPRLESRMLRTIASSTNKQFDKEEKREFGCIKREEELLKHQLEQIENELNHCSWGKTDTWWTRSISEFLEDYHNTAWRELEVPHAPRGGFTTVGSKGKAITAGYLWEQWCNGKGRGIFAKAAGATSDETSIWNLDKNQRRELKEVWNAEWTQPMHERLQSAMKAVSSNNLQLKHLRQRHDLAVLSSVKIIGCTTVGAANLHGLLKPTVVMVEEAGEILEAHVLVNLGPTVEQLILIGDHKQLRPKVANYALEKQSGLGFDLNVSLFERLVLARETSVTTVSVPMVSLTVQHRMRPEIANLIRGMGLYESLEDAPKTHGRPMVDGAAVPIAFVDHRVPEDIDPEAAAVGSETKVNNFEAEFAVAIAIHLLRQGQYRHEDITILTPYVGQLSLIRTVLAKNDVGVVLGDLDKAELAQAEQRGEIERSTPLPKPVEATCHTFRVATVDNYQGEESTIIIASLVRSNGGGGKIGFLSQIERVNVLLSRAKVGMYIVGNLHALTTCNSNAGRALWTKIKDNLTTAEALFDHFPAKCERHGDVHQIKNPAHFDQLAPHGGCTAACGAKLQCGHTCPYRCHPGATNQAVHEAAKCPEVMADVCSYGHPVSRKCHELTGTCRKRVQWKCSRGHTLFGQCCLERKKRCTVCAALDKDEALARKNADEFLEKRVGVEIKLEQARTNLANLKDDNADAKDLAILEEELRLTEEHLRQMEVAEVEAVAPIGAKVRRITGAPVLPDPTSLSAEHAQPADRQVTLLLQRDEAHADEGMTSLMQPMASVSDDNGTPLSDGGSSGTEMDAANASPIKRPKPPTGPAPHARQSTSKIKSRAQRPTTSKCTLESDKDVLAAMQAYAAEDWLTASDKLEKCLPNHCEQNELALLALKSLVDIALSSSVMIPSPFKGPVTTVSTALQCWASFETLSSTHPLLAKAQAVEFTRFVHMYAGPIEFPPQSLKRAKDLCTVTSVSLRQAASGMPQELSQQHELKDKWAAVCKRDLKAPASMDDILDMTGLLDVKEEMIAQYNQIRIAESQGDSGLSSYNARFEGNPGTGKTTVARHYTTFLQQLGVLPDSALAIEVTAAQLINGGVNHLVSELEKAKGAGGGVIFVDEAYQLGVDVTGKRVLDFILPFAESIQTEYGKLVWVFAGYQKDTEKLFEHNLGLPSRFPIRFIFADYTAAELGVIWKSMLEMQDAAPSQPKARTSSKKVANLPTRAYPSVSPYFGGGGMRSTIDGKVEMDADGNQWTFDGSAYVWRDEFGNTTAMGVSNLGTDGNPLVDKDLTLWHRDGATWLSTDGDKMDRYPGSPPKTSGKRVARRTPFRCSDKDAKIAMDRLARQSGRPGFGNARAVRTFFDQVRKRQAARLSKLHERRRTHGDEFQLIRSDMLGPEVNGVALRSSAAYKELQSMLGLGPVKDQIDQLIDLVVANAEREAKGLKLQAVVLNRIFLGNPGTGKTSVARIYGKLLAEVGLLSKGEVIEKCASDFKGDVLGASEKTTRDILRASEGCVLIIDEAYALCGSGLNKATDIYGAAVIDTLVEQVQAQPGDDRAVVLLGYEAEMRQMLKAVNPGLSRRFQLENAFHFPDFSDQDLVMLLCKKASLQDLKISSSVAKRAVRVLAKARAKPNFGNGGAVDTLLSQAVQRKQSRDGVGSCLELEDFGVTREGPDNVTLDSLFDGLVGMTEIKARLKDLRELINFATDRGEKIDKHASFNYLFLGNPGTGKTTVANLMGKMFHSLGLLADDTVYVKTPKDFTTGYLGQAGIQTRDILQSCRGGVLFIDEAYQLNPANGNSYMKEVLDELCAALTEEEFQGKILVVLAGYTTDMEEMLDANPGLQSRFTGRMPFRDLDKGSIVELIKLRHSGEGKIPLSATVSEGDLHGIAKRLAEVPKFSNGRDVDTLCSFAYQEVAKRVYGGTGESEVGTKDLELALLHLCCDRNMGGAAKARTPNAVVPMLLPSAAGGPPRSQIRSTTQVATDEGVASPEEEAVETSGGIDSEISNPFGQFDPSMLLRIQDVLSDMGLNSEIGVRSVASLDPTSDRFLQLVRALVEKAGISQDAATQVLIEWQRALSAAEKQKKKAKAALRLRAVEAIWHCAACGRGGNPVPVCYVAPFISGYRKRTA